jgi:hypothetical protein
MLLLIDIFSINRSRGYENPSLDIIVIELCSTGGFPLEEAHEHCFQNQSVIYVVILISFQCYCGDCSGYIVVILPFLAFYLCSAYFLYLVYYIRYVRGSQGIPPGSHHHHIFLSARLRGLTHLSSLMFRLSLAELKHLSVIQMVAL